MTRSFWSTRCQFFFLQDLNMTSFDKWWPVMTRNEQAITINDPLWPVMTSTDHLWTLMNIFATLWPLIYDCFWAVMSVMISYHHLRPLITIRHICYAKNKFWKMIFVAMDEIWFNTFFLIFSPVFFYFFRDF